MKTVIPFLVLSLSLAGCEQSIADQCMRTELFKQCLAAVPATPVVKVDHSAGDWAQVIQACENSAYYQSKRNANSIKEGCK